MLQTHPKICKSDSTQLLFLIENESVLARKFEEEFFRQEKKHILDDSQAQQLRNWLVFPEEFTLSCDEAQFLVKELLETIVDIQSLPIKMKYDCRIQKALDILQLSQFEKIAASELARQVCLLESRFSHLFTEEIGILLRKYIL